MAEEAGAASLEEGIEAVGCVKGFEVIVLGNVVVASGYRKGEGGGVEILSGENFPSGRGVVWAILLRASHANGNEPLKSSGLRSPKILAAGDVA